MSPNPPTFSGKVFCISFHKTGTTSFHHFMQASGLNSIHGAKWLDGVNHRPMLEAAKQDRERLAQVLRPFIHRYQAFSDTPYNAIYPQLARDYPDAHFVLITRDLDSWWNSIRKHWSLGVLGHRLTTLEYIQYRPYIADCDGVFTRRHRELLIEAHRRHIEEATAVLASRRFLRVELEDPGLHAKIADFLDIGAPAPFPHSRKGRPALDPKRVWKNIRLRFRYRPTN